MTHFAIKVIVCIVAYNGQEAIFVRYKSRPDGQMGWFLPHDLLHPYANPEDVASKLVSKDLGLEIWAGKLLISDVESFRGNDTSWHLTLTYRVEVPRDSVFSSSCDVDEVAWHHLSSLPDRGEVAHHGWATDICARVLTPLA